jgi:hypothetical protein
MPNWIQHSLCPVNDHTTIIYTEGRKKVEMESNRIIHYVKKGFICDEDIEIDK